MSWRRILILSIFILTLIAGSRLWNMVGNNTAETAVANTETASIPLERSTSGTVMSADEQIVFWTGRYERSPQDYISLSYLGQAYISKGRESGDAASYARAEAALQEALTLNPTYEVALAFLSSVRFSQHDFESALELAERVYAFDPDALQALAIIGDAHLELGNYDEVEPRYQELLAQNPSAPVYSRMARLSWLQGDADAALDWMQQAVDDASELGLSGEGAAWYQFQLGELYFNTNQLDKAEAAYTDALATYDNYYLPLAGLGKIHAAHGELDEAIALYEQVTAMVPQPAFIAFLGDLYAIAGDEEAAERQYKTVSFIAQLEEINEVIYNRQLALFYANHDLNLAKAVAISSAELEVRQDVDGYDVAAWALYKNGRFAEAASHIEKALALGTPNAATHYHAGMIYAALDQPEQAEMMLAQALTLNPNFDPLQAQIAEETLAELQNQ